MGAGLRGAGETVWPMLSTLVGMCLVRFPVTIIAFFFVFPYLHHPEWGLIAVWIGANADLNFRAIVNGVVFHRGKWTAKKV
jgi:Na+-driven multidrug efflux pump